MCQAKHCRLQLANLEETSISQKLKLVMEVIEERYPVKHKRGRHNVTALQ